MKVRRPIPRSGKPIKQISAKKLKKLGGRVPFSSITPPRKAPRKVNPKRQAKRKAGYRKMLRSKEHLAAKAEAMARARNQCELWLSWTSYSDGFPQPFELTGVLNATITRVQRCPATEDLHAHHKSYPKGRKLTAAHLTICCKPHHEYLESLKPHKQRMF